MKFPRHTFPLALAAMVAIATIAVLGFDVSHAHAGAAVGFSVASISAPNWYTTQYDHKVSHLLQSEGFLLRGTTDEPVEVVGNTLKFFFMGKATVYPFKQTVELAKPSNLDKTTKDVDMQEWQFFEWVRHGEPEKMSVQYRGKIQEAGSMAMGRKFDRIIIEAMDAEAGNIATIGDGTAAVTPIQVTTGKAAINSLGMMSMNEFFCPVPSIAWEQLKLYKIFNNKDYTGHSLFDGKVEATNWNGVWFFQAPDEMFTSPSAGVFDTYLWNKKTVGFGSNFAMNTKITYENPYTAWAYNTVMSGAAKVLQTGGVKRLRMKVDGALTIN